MIEAAAYEFAEVFSLCRLFYILLQVICKTVEADT
jgi:hypothetical protein